MFRVAICDDESSFLDIEQASIMAYAEQHSVETFIDRYSSGRSLLRGIEGGKAYDLLLLDVEMPDISGMDIAKHFCDICPQMRIAFVSAHADYATLGYHVNAVRFIIKSYNIDEYIHECMILVLREIEYDNRHEVFDFTCGQKDLYINQILYLESIGNYVHFILTDQSDKGNYLTRSSISKETLIMAKYDFISISSQISVNLKHVSSVRRYLVCMDNGIELKISQKKYMEVRERFSLYQGANI